MLTQRIWTIVSIVCLAAAAIFFFWRQNADAAFVAATLGVVAWFVGYRQTLKQKSGANDTTQTEDDDSQEHDED
ncbi:MAG: hypothetical protein WBP93_20910 [Pyrinomonadaceae bacterium]